MIRKCLIGAVLAVGLFAFGGDIQAAENDTPVVVVTVEVTDNVTDGCWTNAAIIKDAVEAKIFRSGFQFKVWIKGVGFRPTRTSGEAAEFCVMAMNLLIGERRLFAYTVGPALWFGSKQFINESALNSVLESIDFHIEYLREDFGEES